MKKFVSTGDQERKLIVKRNRFLSLIRKNPGISRQECAIKLRISTFTISRMTAALIKKKLIIEKSGDKIGKGRPSCPLTLNPDHEYFAGIDFEASSWFFIINDFNGNLLYKNREEFKPAATREKYIEQLQSLFNKNKKECGSLWKKVTALGIGAPGFIDYPSGIITNYEVLPNFTMIPLLDIHRLISGKETCLANNIECLAVHDIQKRAEISGKTILYLAIRSGISSVLSINGKIYSGSDKKAGEIGLFPVTTDKTLQEVAGLSALKKLLPKLKNDFWLGHRNTVEKNYQQTNVKAVITDAMVTTGRVLSGLTAFVDPDEIVVYSPIFSQENVIWELFQKEFHTWRKRQHFRDIPLRRAHDSEYHAAIGAAFHAMESVYQVD